MKHSPQHPTQDPKKYLKTNRIMQLRFDMPCYLVIDGKKQEMDEDIFDQMVQALNPETVQEPPIPTSTRWQPDGTYDKKPNDPNYFSKYYQKKLSTPFTCPDCGLTISSKSNLSKHRQTNISKSNLSKHRQTNICMKTRCQC